MINRNDHLNMPTSVNLQSRHLPGGRLTIYGGGLYMCRPLLNKRGCCLLTLLFCDNVCYDLSSSLALTIYIMWQVIKNHPSSCKLYTQKLLKTSEISEEDTKRISDKVNKIMHEEFEKSKDYVPRKRDWLSSSWAGFKPPEQISLVQDTGYSHSLSWLINNCYAMELFPSNIHPISCNFKIPNKNRLI